ncbi:MAG: zf-TFIIB domain-containing protein [Candidatus Pacebacteria bacterium]|nr:zf-TFIIB domain-containing protein [Candidatus Paceibacterota bacterium]
MQCPRDNTSFTTIRFSAYFETLHFEVCPTCLGMWLDRGELAQIGRLYVPLEKQGELKRWEKIAPVEVSQRGAARGEPSLLCPYGHGSMIRNPYAGDNRMFIDRCEFCGGVWFDGREAVLLWNTIAPHPSHDNLVRALGVYCREQKFEEKEVAGFLPAFSIILSSKIGFLVFLAYLLRPLITNMLRVDSVDESLKDNRTIQ